ncbi:MAG: hypothetical protein U1F57_11860 [bacterium]
MQQQAKWVITDVTEQAAATLAPTLKRKATDDCGLVLSRFF